MSSSTARLGRIPVAVRALLTTTAIFLLAIFISVSAAGTTWAFWNGAVPASGATLKTGQTTLTINDVTAYTMPNLSTTPLLPGRSVVPAQPLVLRNASDVPLSVSITGTSIAHSGLAGSLNISVRTTTGTSCTVTPASEPLPASFTAFTLAKNATAKLCVEVRLASTAPASLQGVASDFTVSIGGTQVRP
ncbi:hypothetical protein [Homoserinibacter sp. YIM 151385]|uniref:hypothetical protein n=1 Tax=Homoserinibacter sp. YIM 151385 TaxID=2985506 RepID=UPI0022F03BD8|nr:hypothetical protein [Homoserinibacter sp. YIM 151385]WBU39147.1 hypothetical protein OF852_06115 [Homoserinibacter sp. YIM 151385]